MYRFCRRSSKSFQSSAVNYSPNLFFVNCANCQLFLNSLSAQIALRSQLIIFRAFLFVCLGVNMTKKGQQFRHNIKILIIYLKLRANALWCASLGLRSSFYFSNDIMSEICVQWSWWPRSRAMCGRATALLKFIVSFGSRYLARGKRTN